MGEGSKSVGNNTSPGRKQESKMLLRLGIPQRFAVVERACTCKQLESSALRGCGLAVPSGSRDACRTTWLSAVT